MDEDKEYLTLYRSLSWFDLVNLTNHNSIFPRCTDEGTLGEYAEYRNVWDVLEFEDEDVLSENEYEFAEKGWEPSPHRSIKWAHDNSTTRNTAGDDKEYGVEGSDDETRKRNCEEYSAEEHLAKKENIFLHGHLSVLIIPKC